MNILLYILLCIFISIIVFVFGCYIIYKKFVKNLDLENLLKWGSFWGNSSYDIFSEKQDVVNEENI